KKLGLIGDFRRLAVLDLKYVDTVGVEKSAMKELHFERQLLVMPKGAFRQKANRPVVVVIQVLQVIRQLVVGSLERFAGEFSRHLPHKRSVKRHRLRASARQ